MLMRSYTTSWDTIAAQYASTEFRAVLAANGLTASMSRKGECWDTAVVKSFFGTMKTELGDPVRLGIARCSSRSYLRVH